MSIFDEQFKGLEQAEVYESGVFMLPGLYLLKVAAIRLVASTKDEGRYFFVVEFVVLQSTNADRPEGMTVTWMVDMSKPKTALSNVQAFLRGISPTASKSMLTPSLIEKLCDEAQPAKGNNIKAEAFIIQTRAGNDFTKIRWTAFAEAPVAA